MACCALAALLFGVIMRLLGRRRRPVVPVRSESIPPVPTGDRVPVAAGRGR